MKGILGLEIKELTDKQLSEIVMRDDQTKRPFDRRPRRPLFNLNDWRD